MPSLPKYNRTLGQIHTIWQVYWQVFVLHISPVCYTQSMMIHNDHNTHLQRLKHLLPAGIFGTLLDVIEPVAPLAAQVLWVMQPTASLFGEQALVAFLAQTLEDPAGISQLRAALQEQE